MKLPVAKSPHVGAQRECCSLGGALRRTYLATDKPTTAAIAALRSSTQLRVWHHQEVATIADTIRWCHHCRSSVLGHGLSGFGDPTFMLALSGDYTVVFVSTN